MADQNAGGKTSQFPFLSARSKTQGVAQKYTLNKQTKQETPFGQPIYSRPSTPDRFHQGMNPELRARIRE